MNMMMRVTVLLSCILIGSCTTAPHVGILAGEGNDNSYLQVGNVVRSRNKAKAKEESVAASPGVAEDFVLRAPKVKLPEDVAAAEAELEELLNLAPKKAEPVDSKLRPKKAAEPMDVVRRPAKKKVSLEPASLVQESGFRRLPRFDAAEQAPPQKKDPDTVDIMDQLVVRTRKVTPHTTTAGAKPVEKKKQQDISLLELNHDGELKEASAQQAGEDQPKETVSGDLFVVRNTKRPGKASRQQQIRTVASTGQHDVVRGKRGGK